MPIIPIVSITKLTIDLLMVVSFFLKSAAKLLYNIGHMKSEGAKKIKKKCVFTQISQKMLETDEEGTP